MWSDSQIAISWIRSDPGLLQVFVSNRVSKIQSLTNIQDWRYINTKYNPADVASRGIEAEKLINTKIWWYGPSFLNEDIPNWPITTFSLPINDLPELKKKALNVVSMKVIERFNLFTMFSSLTKLNSSFMHSIF